LSRRKGDAAVEGERNGQGLRCEQLANRLKPGIFGADLEGLSVKAYIISLVEAHWQELEKNGLLPKGK
jgi:hypothetical protein